jgi:hypothetical protein
MYQIILKTNLRMFKAELQPNDGSHPKADSLSKVKLCFEQKLL